MKVNYNTTKQKHEPVIKDDTVKSPISALRSSRRPCGVRQVRLRTRNFAHLDLEPFTAPSGNIFLRIHHRRKPEAKKQNKPLSDRERHRSKGVYNTFPEHPLAG
jgi:hypothetical protein